MHQLTPLTSRGTMMQAEGSTHSSDDGGEIAETPLSDENASDIAKEEETNNEMTTIPEAETSTPSAHSTDEKRLENPSTPESKREGSGDVNSSSPSLTPVRPSTSGSPDTKTYPSLSECIYGCPEDHEALEGIFAQPDNLVSEQKTPEDAGLWQRQPRVRGHEIQMGQLRRLAAHGIPDEGSHRGVVWRVLLGFLPHENIDLWQDTIFEKRAKYYDYCNDCFLWDDWNFGHVLRVQRKEERRGPLAIRLDNDDEYQSMHVTLEESEGDDQDLDKSTNNDDGEEISDKVPKRPTPSKMFNNPEVLTLIPQSIQDAWTDCGKDLHILESIQKSFNALQLPPEESPEAIQDFVRSAILLDEIHKDVVRTHSDLKFFLDPVLDLGRRRYAAIERVLFLWQKNNTSGVRYVQGMNEIVGALYYVLANDWRTEWANMAEPDVFWLLEALLDDMRDVFVPELDAVSTGIRGRISALQDLLERHDPSLKEHFVELGIDASFYAVRWLTTLLSREFLLPDTIRLWDSMLASTHKDNFLRYVCATMLFLIRDRLLESDFVTCIRMLQRYPNVNMETLLEASRALYIYETQITVACHKAKISRHTALQTINPPDTLIMAFGFPKGLVPQIKKSSSERVRDAFSRLWSWSSDAGNSSSEFPISDSETPAVATSIPEPPPPGLPDEPPDIYMMAIMGKMET